MGFDWSEYLYLAQALLEQPHTAYSREAAQRSAVSRAYYAAFCFARNWAATSLGFVPQGNAGDHAKLRNDLRDGGQVLVADLLDTLRKWRNECDYSDTVPGLAMYAQHVTAQTQAVFANCVTPSDDD